MFLAAASHDLRQPTQALEFFSHALEQDIQDPKLRPLVGNIREVGRSLQVLLDSLLDFSRIEAAAIHPEKRDFAIGELLERIGKDFGPQAEAKGLRLRAVPSKVWVHSDPMLVERILRNFVSNAVKYTEAGGVSIGCRRDGAQVHIEVHDTGIGIPPNMQQVVFKEFYQLANPERDRKKGLGLGLAIASGLARALGHSITLRSTPHHGSVFTIALPRAAPGAIAPSTENDSADDITGKVVLLIDDDQLVSDAATAIMERFGCIVVVAESADEAVGLMQDSGFEPDAIISDYRLRAGATGIDAIHAVLDHCKRAIPAAILTGDTAPDRLREVEASGFLLMHKPLSGAKLRALLSSLLL